VKIFCLYDIKIDPTNISTFNTQYYFTFNFICVSFCNAIVLNKATLAVLCLTLLHIAIKLTLISSPSFHIIYCKEKRRLMNFIWVILTFIYFFSILLYDLYSIYTLDTLKFLLRFSFHFSSTPHGKRTYFLHLSLEDFNIALYI
jgi:hypothetical protein